MIEKEIEIAFIEKHKKKTKITLPIFRKHVIGDYSTIYTRINEDLSAIHITKNDKKWDDNEWGFELQYEEEYEFDGSGSDYHLGKGVYSLSKKEFDRVVEQFRNFTQEII